MSSFQTSPRQYGAPGALNSHVGARREFHLVRRKPPPSGDLPESGQRFELSPATYELFA